LVVTIMQHAAKGAIDAAFSLDEKPGHRAGFATGSITGSIDEPIGHQYLETTGGDGGGVK
jgi:hypothetical protein